MSYSLEKATALLVRELNASPESPLAHPQFQNLLLAPAGEARERFAHTVAQAAGVSIQSVDLPPAPVGALHDDAGIKTFVSTLRSTAQDLEARGGGLLVINDLGRTSQVLQNIALSGMNPGALQKAGLQRIHVLWTADPSDQLPTNVVNRLLPMAVDLSADQVLRLSPQRLDDSPHVRIPDLTTLVGHLPALNAQAERRPVPGMKAAHA